MDRREFMKQLENLLRGLPESDRTDAIAYYNDYFDEAGPENEASVIQELGSPGKVAATIIADLESERSAAGTYRSAEYSYSQTVDAKTADAGTQSGGADGNAGQSVDHRTQGYQEPKTKRKWSWALVIVLLVFASPFLVGVGGGLLGVIVGIIGALIGIILAAFGCVAAGLIGGVAAIGVGIVTLFGNPMIGTLTIGSGSLLFAFGILALLLAIWLCFRWLPALFRWFVDLCHKAFNCVLGK